MKKNMIMMLVMMMLVSMLAGCGKNVPDEAVNPIEDVLTPVEAAETEINETEDETQEVSYYQGYSHYIDPNVASKEDEDAIETETQGNEQTDGGDTTDDVNKVDNTETVAPETETNVETEVAEQTQPVESAPEAVTYAPEPPAPSVQETYTDTIPETITMDPSFVRCSMYVVYDTQVKDAPYAASGNQGLIVRGSNIGVMERCIETGYYRVNYGAKAAYLPPDALTMEDPFK